MDALRFGAIDHADTARVVPGGVSGISHYGNCLGLPNLGLTGAGYATTFADTLMFLMLAAVCTLAMLAAWRLRPAAPHHPGTT